MQPTARVIAVALRLMPDVSEKTTNGRTRMSFGLGGSTRWCAGDRLVVVRNMVDLGGVGVAASGTRSAARS